MIVEDNEIILPCYNTEVVEEFVEAQNIETSEDEEFGSSNELSFLMNQILITLFQKNQSPIMVHSQMVILHKKLKIGF